MYLKFMEMTHILVNYAHVGHGCKRYVSMCANVFIDFSKSELGNFFLVPVRYWTIVVA